MRIYQREGKSKRYLEKKEEFQRKEKREAMKYKTRSIDEVTSGQGCSAYKAIRKLGKGAEDVIKRKSITLPSHADQGFTLLTVC